MNDFLSSSMLIPFVTGRKKKGQVSSDEDAPAAPVQQAKGKKGKKGKRGDDSDDDMAPPPADDDEESGAKKVRILRPNPPPSTPSRCSSNIPYLIRIGLASQ